MRKDRTPRCKDPYWDFQQAIVDAALDHGGIPHWGQEFKYENSLPALIDAGILPAEVKENLKAWNKVRENLDPKNYFQTTFSKSYGLG